MIADISPRAWELARTDVMPGQQGSPTEGEVLALMDVYLQRRIPEDVREAVLLTTNGGNRSLVEGCMDNWNTLVAEAPPAIRKSFRNLTLTNFSNSISLRGVCGLVDYSPLIKTCLTQAVTARMFREITNL